MAKIGDRVRFLNATGGGIITRIVDKTAYVEDEDGFESPFLIKDLVVVMPAGHEPNVKGAGIMFDQKAFDEGKKMEEPAKPKEIQTPAQPVDEFPAVETEHGDNPSLVLAFEPDNIKQIGTTRFAAVLVNDSNYFLDFVFLRRASEEVGWSIVYNGTVAPNELINLAVVTHEELLKFEKVAFQCIAYKKDKAFSLIPPVSVTRKLDLTKFHKLHCFHDSRYFDSPVLEFPIIADGMSVKQADIDPKAIEESMSTPQKDLKKELSKKYKTDFGHKHQKSLHPEDNPFKKLPLIEIDLHIGELTDTIAGMEPKDMLELQLDEVRKTMQAHSRRAGQKIVFIHGKGEGVLRKAVLELLKKEYPKATLQDASFREYGFGATLVTI